MMMMRAVSWNQLFVGIFVLFIWRNTLWHSSGPWAWFMFRFQCENQNLNIEYVFWWSNCNNVMFWNQMVIPCTCVIYMKSSPPSPEHDAGSSLGKKSTEGWTTVVCLVLFFQSFLDDNDDYNDLRKDYDDRKNLLGWNWRYTAAGKNRSDQF